MAEHVEEPNGVQKPEDSDGPRINGVAQKFLADLMEERERLSSEFPLCALLIDDGRGSMRGTSKEEELRESGDPRYAHLHRDLYVEISTVAPPAEAHARVAYALAEIRKYLIPDKNDDVSQEQLRELMKIDPKSAQSYSKTVLNKFPTAEGSKFLKLIKRSVAGIDDEEMEELEEEDDYHSR
ncbi:KH domain-containing, RNA-binding, signal transduction-associated protein 2-like isoform X2 [Eurosta solidaginis]|uniref:KH domain-containing, RNA-binding, signal transduction-associated protein 2-like isoform X2 n=1 Tax=Eurosta solidaginis TaxID=178769 RepID=UPI003530712C